MKTKRKRISRWGWDKPGDEMVPIRGDRVKAALDAYEASLSHLADEVGDSQQTISLICGGITKKTRRSRVEKLADVLNVPESWLTGEAAELPGARSILGMKPGAMPAAWQLALARWHDQTGEAHARSLDVRRKRPPFESFLRQGFAISLFVNPGVWREILLKNYDNGIQPLDDDDPLSEYTQIDFTNALLDILHPWLSGKYELNYSNLMTMLGRHASMAVEYLKETDPEWKRKLLEGAEISSKAKHQPKTKGEHHDSLASGQGPAFSSSKAR